MSLRNKFLLTLGITLLVGIVVLYGSAQTFLISGIVALEKQYTRNNVERVMYLLDSYEKDLTAYSIDWAEWNDSYCFIHDQNSEHHLSNVLEKTFIALQFNLFLVVESDGNIVCSRAFDLEQEKEVPLPPGLQPHLAPGSLLLSNTDPQKSTAGLLVLPEGILLVVSRPIVESTAEGPAQGTLILGRFLDKAQTDAIGKVVNTSVTFRPYDDPNLPPDYREALAGLTDQETIVVHPLDENTIGGYALLRDLYGQPAVVLHIDASRDIYRQGKLNIIYFVALLLVLTLVLFLANWLFWERSIFSRLATITETIFQLGASGDLSKRVTMPGTDELAILGTSINQMLDTLENAGSALQESEEKFRKLAETSPAVIFILREGQLRYINPIAEQIFGYTHDELMHILPEKIFSATSLRRIQKTFNVLSQGKNGTTHSEFEAQTKSGEKRYFELTTSVIEYQGASAIIGTAYDITQRKLTEEQLRYLSIHDSLSGLYNRAFFEEEVSRIEQGRLYPVSVIIADIDRLKATNDSLGHAAGDELIKRTAAMIRKAFRSEDIIARIGGDEFAVLLPGLTTQEAQKALERLRHRVANQAKEIDGLSLEISAGVATCEKGCSLVETMKEADEAMYREKQMKRL
ncbi:MAG: diguanylate cyclase [Chloroflexi bacterium]|nr:diguanylate cyclase [Chloroflexota bacterium]